MRLPLALTASLVLLLAAPAGAAQIQPGLYHEIDGSACTLGFVFDGPGGPYVSTAAHCAGGTGKAVSDIDGVTWGDVAAIGDENDTARDWALIRVRPGFAGDVRATVQGHPGVPSGVVQPGELGFGDQIVISGYGLPFNFVNVTRERRPGFFSFDQDGLYTVIAPIFKGDSGGPIAARSSRKALGLVSRLCLGTCTQEGPMVAAVMQQAAAQGLAVSLRNG